MDILFDTSKLEALVNDDRKLKKTYGLEGFKKIRQRLDDLYASGTLEDMKYLPGKTHELTGDRAGQLSLRLHGGFRLILIPEEDPPPAKDDGGLDWSRVTAVRVLEIEDYHG